MPEVVDAGEATLSIPPRFEALLAEHLGDEGR